MKTDVKAPWRIQLCDTEIGEEEIAAVTRVLRSGWVTAGPELSAFEREFAEACGVRHAIAVTNGTAALHLAHLALDLGPDDEVLCPALTFVATANAARYTGARPVFVDVIGPDDLTLSPADLERKITPRTRAIVVMHYAGFPCRMDDIRALAERHRLPIIEDCAHAPLARHVGADGTETTVGRLGAIGAFSFFGNKNMTTGEGGMLTTDDDELAARMRLSRSHGMTSASYDRSRGHASDYDVTALGYNYRMDDLRAAVGRAQLAKLPRFNRQRRQVFGWYLEELADAEGFRVPFSDRPLHASAPHIMSVVVERDLDARRRRLTEAGVQVSRHYDPVSSFAIYGRDTSGTPTVAGLALLTLPFGPGLSRDQVRQIARLFRGD
jgi:dTDP-4-amino-4,6-dideoxygalactose transaminase